MLEELIDHAHGISCVAETFLRKDIYEPPRAPFPSEYVRSSLGTVNTPPRGIVRMLSWNTYGKAEELEGFVKKHDVDIITLQEASRELLNRLPEFHKAYAPDTFANDGQQLQGNMTLSRYPIAEIKCMNLPIVTWKYHAQKEIRRNALYTKIGDVGVWNTHLDIYCRPKMRKLQALPVAAALNGQAIIGIDANTILGKEPLFSLFERYKKAGSFVDYIFTNGLLLRGEKLKSKESDHSPVLADILF